MNISTEHVLVIDFKIAKQIKTLTFAQFDTNIVKFIIEDNGEVANLSRITNAIVNFRRPDKRVVSQTLTINGNEMIYQLTEAEMAVVGNCEMVLQLYEGENRKSTAKMKVVISENIEIGDPPTFEEVRLINQLIETVNERVAELADYDVRLGGLENDLGSAVKKVNGVVPDVNGNVVIPVPEIDATNFATKQDKTELLSEIDIVNDQLTAQLAERVFKVDYDAVIKPTLTKNEIQEIVNQNTNIKVLSGVYEDFSAIQIPSNRKIAFDANVKIVINTDNTSVFIGKGDNITIIGKFTEIDLNNKGMALLMVDGLTDVSRYKNINVSGFLVHNRLSVVPSYRAIIRLYGVDRVKISDVHFKDYGSPSQITSTTLVYGIITGSCTNVDIEKFYAENIPIAFCSTDSSHIKLKNFYFKKPLGNGIYILPNNYDITLENGFLDGENYGSLQGITIYGDTIKIKNVTVKNCPLVGIMLRGATNVFMSELTFVGNACDIMDQNETQSKFVKIKECISDGATGVNAILLRRASDWDITNFTFKNILPNQIVIRLDGWTSNYLQRVSIKDCTFVGDTKQNNVTPTGISMRVAADGVVNACRFERNHFINMSRAIDCYRTTTTVGGTGNYFLYNTFENCDVALQSIPAGNFTLSYGS